MKLTYSRRLGFGLAIVVLYHLLPLALVRCGAYRAKPKRAHDARRTIQTLTIPTPFEEGMVCGGHIIQVLSLSRTEQLLRGGTCWCSAGAAPEGELVRVAT